MATNGQITKKILTACKTKSGDDLRKTVERLLHSFALSSHKLVYDEDKEKVADEAWKVLISACIKTDEVKLSRVNKWAAEMGGKTLTSFGRYPAAVEPGAAIAEEAFQKPDISPGRDPLETMSAETFSSEMATTLSELAARISAAADFGNIAAYQAEFQKKADAFGIAIKQVTMRPFGFVFLIGRQKHWFRSTKGRLVCEPLK